ncbi:hypothetical protein [Bacteroides faecalis]|uniref:Uncharacterized protein n=1 Tax=Bacteroides faecalis TaxID=2447885 RepID=A0A401LYR3_9BACE|nr:hypothetical protein [Bacteroides faecalis]GCB36651.1 hypothetical protein KGMB02408_35960 [Bacteroides faecalis]
MATTEEIEKYCRNCVSRDFVNGKGLVCKRSREFPAFEEECENFENDEELTKMAPPKPEDFPVTMTREELLAQENLLKGLLLAIIASLVGAVAWGLVSVSTGYQIGYMAIAIGLVVGFAMRQGKGIRPIFGIIGGALALISCVLGDFFSIIGFASREYDMPFFEVLTQADFKTVFSIIEENLVSMSTLFYVIAVYEGYKFSFRPQNQPKGGQI